MPSTRPTDIVIMFTICFLVRRRSLVSIKKVATLTIAALILGVALGSFGIAGALDNAADPIAAGCGANCATADTSVCDPATCVSRGAAPCGNPGVACGMGASSASPWAVTP
jgi:hypothetical protein